MKRMLKKIKPKLHWFPNGTTWKFWVIEGCSLYFLTSEQAVEFRKSMSEGENDSTNNNPSKN